MWAGRAGVQIIKSTMGADPAAVVYDSIMAAKARGTDVILCDTAGRLQNKKNLMDELGKITRVAKREFEGEIKTLLVLDANTGQNRDFPGKGVWSSSPGGRHDDYQTGWHR